MNQTNPTPASLRACPCKGWGWISAESDSWEACTEHNRKGKRIPYRLFDELRMRGLLHLPLLLKETAPEPPAVRCAGNEDALRVAAGKYVACIERMGRVVPNSATERKVMEAECRAAYAKLEAALSAPVPQPPAGNEEPASTEAGSAELRAAAQKAVDSIDFTNLGGEAQDAFMELEQVLEDLQAPQPAPAAGTDEGPQAVLLKHECPICHLDQRDCDHGPAPATGTDVCQTCKGRGKHGPHVLTSDPPQQKPCPACNGTGKATACQHRCDEGKVYVSAERKSWKPCPLHGHGKREDRP